MDLDETTSMEMNIQAVSMRLWNAERLHTASEKLGDTIVRSLLI